MRILLLESRSPLPSDNGAKMRNWAILRGLAAEGHRITLLAFSESSEENTALSPLSSLCCETIWIPHEFKSVSSSRDYAGRLKMMFSRLPYGVRAARSAAMRAKIAELIETGCFDAILCEEIDLLANIPANSVPLILDFHNVDHLILERYAQFERNLAKKLYARIECGKFRGWEKYACRRAAAALACSEHDAALLQQFRPELSIYVVPNAIEVSEYAPKAAEDQSNKILFQGGMDWYPNRDAVEFFAEAIFPRIRAEIPEVRFVVAGRGASPEFQNRMRKSPGVEFTGAVPDMKREIASAAVCVVPLRIGSGTRLKILEAAAMSKAIVSTRLGAEGLHFADGGEIRIEDDISRFAAAVVDLLKSEELRRRIGKAARSVVENRYGLGAVQRALSNAFGRTEGATARPEPWHVERVEAR